MKQKIEYLILLLFILTSLSGCQTVSQFLAARPEEASEENSAQQEEVPEEYVKQDVASPRNLKVDLSQEQLTLIDDIPRGVKASDWELTLINRENRIKHDLNWPLETTDSGQLIDQRILRDFTAWAEQAEKDGHPLQLISGFRTIEHQEENFNNTVNKYLSQGYSQEEALEMTHRFQQPPGASEHHTGLAVDIISRDFHQKGGGLTREFAKEASYPYYIETMVNYGFILRYPEDKTDITGVYFEPWHYRYVGKENAEFMADNNLTLEEFHALIEARDKQ